METREEHLTKPEPADRRASSLPIILTMVSLLLWFGFQTIELAIERSSLLSLTGNLEGAVRESQKVHAQLEALITKTVDLAKQGNPSARKVVEELEQKGIPIRADAPPPK